MRNPWFRSAGIALLVLTLSVPVRAQSPLAQIPAKTPLVVQVKGVENVRERIGKMLGNALPDLAPAINPALEAMFKVGPLAERDLTTLPKDGTVFMVATSLEGLSEDNPTIGFLFPVKDYASFKKGMLTDEERKNIKKGKAGVEMTEIAGQDVFMLDRKSYVLVTTNEDVVADFSKKIAPLDSQLGPDAAQALLTPDIALFLNVESLNEQYGEQLQAFKGLIDLGLGQVEGMDDATKEMTKKFINGFLQVFEDGKAFIISGEFRPEGMQFRFAIAFKSDTPSNEFLGKLKTSPFTEIGSMPSGQMSYSASRMDKALRDTIGEMAMNLSQGNDNAAITKKMKAIYSTIGANSTGISYTVSNIPYTGIEVIGFNDPKAAVTGMIDMLKLIPEGGNYNGTALKSKPKIEVDAEKHRDFVFTSVSMRLDLEKALEGQTEGVPEEVKEAMKAALIKMFGSEEIKLWMGTDGKQFIQLTAPNWKIAQKLLDDYLDGKSVAKNDAFAATRKQLPPEATFLTMFETSRSILGLWDYMGAILKAIPGFPLQEIPDLQAAKGEPSYFGIAIVLKKDLTTAELFIPTTAVQQIRTIFAPLAESFGQ